jgi:uncharacterized NAD(P)/FAD-binding protein YdhS
MIKIADWSDGLKTKMSSEITTVAIIGGGVSGALVAVQLLRNEREPLRIKLLEPREQLGRGIAYSTQAIEHLLNVPASNVSAFPDEPGHFLNWFRQHRDPDADGYTFIPRLVYAQYITQLFDAAKRDSAPSVSVEHIRDRARSILPAEGAFEILLEHAPSLKAHSIVLALGNDPADNPLPQIKEGGIVSAWSPIALDNLPRDSAVILVGAGLTAIDVCLSLLEEAHRGPVFVVSRRGLFPRVHLEAPASARPAFAPNSSQTVRALLRDIRESAADEIARGGSWHLVIDSFRPQTNEIWQRLSLAEKRRFMRHLRPYWEVHRHRMAAHVHRRIEAMRSSGQLRVICGRLAGASTERSGEVKVRVFTRNEPGEITLNATRVINCTGPQNDPRRSSDPLIRQILADGIGRPDPLFLGLETGLNGALIAADDAVWHNIFAIGPSRKGTVWETTAVPEIRRQAEEVAREILGLSKHVPSSQQT